MTAYLLDTETTGIKDPVPVEVAHHRTLGSPENFALIGFYCQRFNPGKPIELGAMATHHIKDEDVAQSAPFEAFKLPDDAAYIIGHNVDYDWQAIGQPPIKRICTLAMCRSLYPEADSHTQSAMMYLLYRHIAKERLVAAHSAAADVENCAFVLRAIVKNLCAKGQIGEHSTWDDLWAISETMRVPTIMPFGKHKGEPIRSLPRDYRSWLLRQADVDQYLLKALHA